MIRSRKTSLRMHVPVCAVIISGLVTSVLIGSEGIAKSVDSQAEVPRAFEPSGSRAGSIPADCDNNGVVNHADFAMFTPFLNGPIDGSAGGCRCFDIDGSTSVDLRDFAAVQRAFGTTSASPEPPPSNIFVLQLAEYHDRCGEADGGDGTCHIGDACCQTQTGPAQTPCDALQGLWTLACDLNGDGQRDRSAHLNALA